MTTLTENPHTGEFIASEAPGTRSREAITLTGDGSATVKAGTVLGKVETGTPTATAGTPFSAGGGTVGNGTVSAVSADAGAEAGTWQIEIVGAAGATAAFKVVKPDGTVDGEGAVGTPYNGTINATVADGSTDWGPNHIIPIEVEYQDGESVPKYEAYDQDGTDGSEVAAGILYAEKVGTVAGVDAVAVARDAEVNGNLLTWPSDITADEKAVAISQLAALNIRVRF